MFVFSVKSLKLKLIAIISLVLIACVVFIYISKRDKPAAAGNAINYSATNEDERRAFLSQFGWETAEEPLEVVEVIIPSEFDDVYESYNKIQLEQNLNLKLYSGYRVKRWTYEITNYKGYEGKKGYIRANLLVYDGRVIGGDICSVELDGFMHGFKNPNAPAEKTTGKAEATTVAETTTAPKKSKAGSV
ncbi:MAG: DUF4830 domain-containing protein [Clostridiales bacterium]|jgi:hypothetical protein|nr:DUF4830 domain-containing protein [Clostridiales bacterium]